MTKLRQALADLWATKLTNMQKIPLIILMAMLDALITITVASTTMMFVGTAGLNKSYCFIVGILLAITTMFYLRFNHKLRNKLIKE